MGYWCIIVEALHCYFFFPTTASVVKMLKISVLKPAALLVLFLPWGARGQPWTASYQEQGSSAVYHPLQLPHCLFQLRYQAFYVLISHMILSS